jgi:hypothetical protein
VVCSSKKQSLSSPAAAAGVPTPDPKTPSPSSGTALGQTKLSRFFNLKGASGPRPAVPAPAAASSPAQTAHQEGSSGPMPAVPAPVAASSPAQTAAPAQATPKDKGPKEEKESTVQLMAAASAGDGPLIPSSFVSFCEDPSRRGGFTPIYEHQDGSSYADFKTMASVNAGAFRLYVGGGAINRSQPLLTSALHGALASSDDRLCTADMLRKT